MRRTIGAHRLAYALRQIRRHTETGNQALNMKESQIKLLLEVEIGTVYSDGLWSTKE